jgi:predicted ATPase
MVPVTGQGHIKRIRIENFLSFDHFEWEALDDHLNVVVGPNGAGKTNLFHALHALCDLLGYERSAYWRRTLIQQSTHRNSRDRPIRFALDLEFDAPGEAGLMRAFLAAALCEGDGNDYVGMERVSHFLYECRSQLDVSALLVGRLVITCDPMGNWSSWYQSGDPAFYWAWGLQGPGQGLLTTKDDTASSERVFDALRSSYAGLPVRSPLGAGLELVQPGDLKRFDDYINGAPDLPHVPDVRSVISGRSVHLEVRGQNASRLPTHREFARLVGLREGDWHNHTYGGLSLLHMMIRRAFVFTENVRRSPRAEFSAEEANSPAPDLSNGEQLALHLYRKKNGLRADRGQYHQVRELFHRLTNEHIDIGQVEPEIVPAAQGNRPPQGLRLEMRVEAEWGDIPLEYSGAGRGEALFLSSVIIGTEGKVVLLDEPAQNLHPTAQSVILRELRQPRGSQFIVVTHSPTLVPADIRSVSRFYTRGGATQLAKLGGDGNEHYAASIEKALLRSADVKQLLFTRGVVLVEGETETASLPAWYARHLGYDPDSVDIVFHGVRGDKGFAKYMRFARELGLPYVVVCDGPVIGDLSIDGGVSRISNQLRDAGVDGLPDLSNEEFSTRCEILSRFGVITPVTAAGQETEDLPGVAEHLAEAKGEVGGGKVDQVHWVALNRPIPPRIEELLELIDHRIGR